MTLDLSLAADFAEGAARTAGAMLRRDFLLPRQVRDKGVNDLVTQSDLNSERLIARMLHHAFPDHGISAEEFGDHERGTDFTWWIDPLDATHNFVHGIPRFSVSIACVDSEGLPLLGIVYDPMRDECFRAVRGEQATCNGAAIHVSSAVRLRDSLIASGFRADLSTEPNNMREWAAFVSRTQGASRMGSAALDMCYVAAGRFDLYWEYATPPLLDRVAGQLIVECAGGRVTTCEGAPFYFLRASCVMASNATIHDEALAVIREVSGGQ
ncbi:MAG TPA: inositol monophosphatase family protein [Aggregatilineales bacterium]|nr:inositol monophosphatase family protein [Aggregatilineales bacterium]